MKYILALIIPIFFNGCLFINERGISTKLYNECREYYDLMGYYHKDCDKNLIDFRDIEGINGSQTNCK